jgi:hypothetical protein
MGLAGDHPRLHESSQSMPDLWDTNPDNVFSPPDEQPDPAPSGHDDYPNEVRLKDERGRLRLPAYILIALGIAVVAILLGSSACCSRPGRPVGTGGVPCPPNRQRDPACVDSRWYLEQPCRGRPASCRSAPPHRARTLTESIKARDCLILCGA